MFQQCVLSSIYIQFNPMKHTVNLQTSLPDPGGRTWRAPQGTQFFRFDIQILRNIAASGVHAPLRGPRPPYGKILDPPLNMTPCLSNLQT